MILLILKGDEGDWRIMAIRSKKMPYFQSNRSKLYYEEHGNGPPLLLTHGASLDHRMWESQVERFGKSRRVITWDVRGHGRSSLPPGPVNPDLFSQDLIALLDTLGIENAILCGLSMGGHISLQTAIRFSDRVKALILIGTICTNAFNTYERIAVPINVFSLRFIPMGLLAKLEAWYFCRRSAAGRVYIEETVKKLPPNNWKRLWAAITSMESRQGLSLVTCPTILLIGDGDVLTRRQQGYINEHIIGSRVATIPDAGHATNLDNPGAVNKVIENFLEDLD